MPSEPPLLDRIHGVDADQPACGIDERAARVARIDGGVGLHEVVDRLRSPADDRAHDALRHRLADAKRIAHGEHDVTDCDVVHVGECDGRQVAHVDLEKREVGRRIRTTICAAFSVPSPRATASWELPRSRDNW
jgi:hypothetical protein